MHLAGDIPGANDPNADLLQCFDQRVLQPNELRGAL